MRSVTELLEEGMTPEEILEELLGDFGLEISETIPAQFYCNCSKERVSHAIASINREELDQLIEENEPIEVKCQFCNGAYDFSVEDLKEIVK